MEQEELRTKVKTLLAEGVLLSPDATEEPISPKDFPKNVIVINKDTRQAIKENRTIDWIQLDTLRVRKEKGHAAGYDQYITYVSKTTTPPDQITKTTPTDAPTEESPLFKNQTRGSVKVVNSYEKESYKRTVKDFVQHFTKRYKTLERMLRSRPELQQGLLSINRALKKKSKEQISLIGMVTEKNETKNGNLMISIEDPTGIIKILVNKNKPELFAEAKDIVPDEIIGVSGVSGDRIVFVNTLVWPDIPYDNEIKKSPTEAHAIFLSDIHVGSNTFLEKEFAKFLQWINGKMGNPDQRALAKKIQYILISGDLVDGVGIYPGQDKELVITDITQQYSEFARLLSQIPAHINIVLSPGNHDAMRLSEPQPKLDKDYAAAVYSLPNVTLVSNPGMVNIHSSDDFEGFNILLYHGYSFDYYVANVDSIRNNGGYHRGDLIMKYLLKRRHLGPSHESTLRILDPDEDPLIITKIPDIFATGHIHYSVVANYRNITLISGSCWQGTTSFQEKMGHKPEPARVPIVNLKTREVKIMKFI